MKVNTPNTFRAERWWVGKTMTCGVCGAKVTLESTDFPAAYLTDTNRVVSATCPGCGQHLEVSEPLTP